MDERLKVGATIYMKPVGNNARYLKGNIIDHVTKMIITKVSRKYFYVSRDSKEYSHHDTKMRIDEMRDDSIYSAYWRAYFSLQDILDEEEQDEIHKYLKYDVFNTFTPRLSLDQLRRIKAITDEDR